MSAATERRGWRELARYPSALLGVLIILLLGAVALATPLVIPYGEALERWRGSEMWQRHPVNASPAWVDRLRGGNAARTLTVASHAAEVEEVPFPGGRRLQIPLEFDYAYGGFPSEINLFLAAEGHARAPFVRLTWEAPDGREVALGGYRVGRQERVSISQDRGLERRLGGLAPHIGLLSAPLVEGEPEVLKGSYRLLLDAVVFDEQAGLEAELVLYGRVHGIAGTDHQRRDLSLALLWGTPVALAFGLIAAVGTTLTTLVIAAVGVWYRGWVDAVIQRLTEVNMILPVLPILVMVGTLYSTSIWLMLGVVVLLGIFSAGIKTYRAMLLPIREAPYIEAALAYGASDLRIVMRYMLPRILPVLIPTFVTLIPTFVFLEASLAVLGLGDPELPTWGKVLNDAQSQSALYNGYVYWVVAPAILLMLTGLGFAMLGFALDRVFNPRLRSL
ncbi:MULTISPECIES: ABC transporter permease [Halomonas]|uniref:ABC transporter permease n=1 Tax=Halomonas TaxID=2745 RepID=UPI000D7118F3|nr:MULTISPECIES: ABC transporter permease [Halomonas]PWV70527.1 peptide/nickel transport system permease protein [Halomonas sp. A11-A]QJQ98814.1 ABC transporter permease [Halomonas sp. PGE1]